MYNPKYQLHKLLKEAKIKYTTSKDHLKIGNVSASFYFDSETITFRDTRRPTISFTTPFASAHALLFKLRWFQRSLTPFLPENSIK